MDNLAESFGQLSTQAKEWRPASERQARTLSQQPYATNYAPAVPLSPIQPRIATNMTPQPRSPTLQQAQPGRTGWQQAKPGNQWMATNSPEYVPSWHQHQQQQHQPNLQQPNLQQPNLQASWNIQHATGAAAAAASSPDYPTEDTLWNTQEQLSSATPAESPPPIRSIHSLGVPDGIWRYHRDIALESQRQMEPTDPLHKAVPPGIFRDAFLLDTNKKRSSFGYPIATFKVISRDDGFLYCLRRVDNVKSVSHGVAAEVTECWITAVNLQNNTSVLDHPGVVRFYRCFVANRAVFFLHQYCPGARTVRERFMDPSTGGGIPLPEPLVWSCITQLASGIRAVHSGRLACRTLHLNHILCTGAPDGSARLRFWINCLGVVDALECEARKQIHDLQREDMRDLGRIIMSLATGTEVTRSSDLNTIGSCDAFLAKNYSPSLHGLVVGLLRPSVDPPSIFDVCNSISSRAFDELDAQLTVLDRTDSALAAEYDSGRALRLLLKMGFVNERPELGMNRRWTESGDCYVLKLFRDYVFHQADGGGNPVMDLGHVITSLNKLDAAVEEKIVLSSRDGKTLMVVSYGDVARSLESAYGELCSGAVMPSSIQY